MAPRRYANRVRKSNLIEFAIHRCCWSVCSTSLLRRHAQQQFGLRFPVGLQASDRDPKVLVGRVVEVVSGEVFSSFLDLEVAASRVFSSILDLEVASSRVFSSILVSLLEPSGLAVKFSPAFLTSKWLRVECS